MCDSVIIVFDYIPGAISRRRYSGTAFAPADDFYLTMKYGYGRSSSL
jgi:hypothetical protein